MSDISLPIMFHESRLAETKLIQPELNVAFDDYVSRHAGVYLKDVDAAVEEILSIEPTPPLSIDMLPKHALNDDMGIHRIIGFDFRNLGGLGAYWHMRSRFSDDLSNLFNADFLKAEEMKRVVLNARFSGHTATAAVVAQPIGILQMTDSDASVHLFMREIRQQDHIGVVIGREIATIDPLVWAHAGSVTR